MLTVEVHVQDVTVDAPSPGALRTWFAHVVDQEGGPPDGHISIVLCSDDALLEMNRRFLDHHDLTDVITFPMSDQDDVLEGEIYISVDRVRDNATSLGESPDRELLRVIVHGLLHLCGYGDATHEDKLRMRSREEAHLAQWG